MKNPEELRSDQKIIGIQSFLIMFLFFFIFHVFFLWFLGFLDFRSFLSWHVALRSGRGGRSRAPKIKKTKKSKKNKWKNQEDLRADQTISGIFKFCDYVYLFSWAQIRTAMLVCPWCWITSPRLYMKKRCGCSSALPSQGTQRAVWWTSPRRLSSCMTSTFPRLAG